ncbi:MAG: hypothetical protein RLZ98_2088 [Pseudomonadota bacterium]|jgi:GTP cyclohydrolase II/3,4-dihydroxy 2-butanone 4-phosphate synthase/GTP cyclohydrolase II
MSKNILAAQAPEVGTSTVGAGMQAHGANLAQGAQMLNMRNGAQRVSNATARRAEAPMFVDRARTILPIEFKGSVVELEAHAYEDDTVSYQAMALVHRTEAGSQATPIVRVHSGCVTGDIFHSLRCDCYQQLQKALDVIIASDNGIIVYLPHHEGRGIGLVNKIKAYAAQDRGLDTVDANLSIGAPIDARDYELAAKILKDLGAETVKLMTNNPAKVSELTKLGIDVVEQVAHVVRSSPYNERYLATKRERMAHKL